MDRMIYIAMSAARQAQLRQRLVAQNLANLSTTGFRATLADVRTLWLQGPGLPARAYGAMGVPRPDLTPGSVTRTGRELDIAVEGRGFIAVQAPDGSEAYTRAGNLKIDAAGRLVTAGGLPVLGNGGPVALPPARKIEIGKDGTVSVVPAGQALDSLAVVDRIKLVRPEPRLLVRGTDGLLRIRGGGSLPPDGSVRVVSGALENSNVDVVGGMVRMIELGRRYEFAVRMMRAASENDRAADSMVRMGA